jgi:hypothetical protein
LNLIEAIMMAKADGYDAGLADGRYTDKQKEWLARYLATGLASGPGDKVHKVDIDEWIKEVKAAFDLIEKMHADILKG